MRDSKFRGKRLDNGEWVIGLLVKMWGEWHILDWDDENTAYPVEPNTVGQYTGLKDKNGEEIWEGDIFKDDRGVARSVFRVPGGLAFEDDPVSFGYDHRSPAYPYTPIADPQVVSWLAQCCEIIGNIHDDPKLLEQ